MTLPGIQASIMALGPALLEINRTKFMKRTAKITPSHIQFEYKEGFYIGHNVGK